MYFPNLLRRHINSLAWKLHTNCARHTAECRYSYTVDGSIL